MFFSLIIKEIYDNINMNRLFCHIMYPIRVQRYKNTKRRDKMNPDRVIAVRNRKTVYRDADKCIKVFNVGYSKSDVFGEALNQVCAEEAGLKVPAIEKIITLDGKWAIVSEYIKGKTLEQLILEKPEKRNEYLETLVSLQLEVHSKEISSLSGQKDILENKLRRAKISEEDRTVFLSRLSEMPDGNNLCHGDFSFSNIIAASDGAPYILDWAHACRGDTAADAAKTYILFMLGGDIDYAEKYLSLFCEKSGKTQESVRQWLPLTAAAQSADGNEHEREILLSWLNNI